MAEALMGAEEVPGWSLKDPDFLAAWAALLGVPPEAPRESVLVAILKSMEGLTESIRQEIHGRVYFIRREGLIKIGYTADLSARMAVLDPDEILLVLPGDRNTERAFHRKFADERVEGEWFTESKRLRHYIRRRRVEQLR